MSRISVIVTIYKTEAFLHRCIDSILSQSHRNFELILVEDGSPDHCGVICDAYAKQDSRIHVIHQKHQGVSVARNVGVDKAMEDRDSQWLIFIDSDDWVHPDYLSTLYQAVLTTELSLSLCTYIRTHGEEPTISREQLNPKIWNTEDFFVERNTVAIIPCAKLYPKDSFQSIRYPAGKIHEDEYITYKLLFPHEKIAVVNAPLYFYYKNPESITECSWSPQRLDSLDAFKGQVRYFRKNHYPNAYYCALDNYFDSLKSASYNLRHCSPPYPQLTRKINRRFRKAMIQYGKDANFTLKTAPHLYE